MAFVEIDQPFLSDLLVKEREDYYSRAEGIVSIAAGETSPQGTVFFRAKGTDPAATWTKVVAAGNLVTTNEFAILAGDHYNIQKSVTFATTTPKTALFWVRDAEFKQTPILAIHDAALSDAEFATLKKLLADQELFIAKSAVAAT